MNFDGFEEYIFADKTQIVFGRNFLGGRKGRQEAFETRRAVESWMKENSTGEVHWNVSRNATPTIYSLGVVFDNEAEAALFVLAFDAKRNPYRDTACCLVGSVQK
ncbi:hypothetical protein [Burkholderia multivorans]|uniref:hypothetical protein n=1 Tax=Burkholderia multivorans TaxID=87883 RepID=UPI0011B1E699|nr:hypothetical protein [Burkholderia multivorans]